ncbi:hypothetical protein BJY16_001860 [Actinoplanes octamycinicus]|uniref:Uncharacterized protein n=1 Tax=Actinoplanes octamycinicus TaxID=135948 RepID=A0A7W7GUC3_9ACTN|nr:hypothetical protein [Actinoplanes octamycinicus]MBB4738401.1 hypothetical protein [Actinoplanes octamycinicus]GIE57517.1 hypothetical protein Aoc01nite_29190 [Actinoplanes octamycinicus]
MTLTEDELRAVLRAEAAAHTPDRIAILNRVTGTAVRTEAARGRRPRIRIAGAAVAVAAVVGGGGFAQWALAGMGEERPAPPPPPTTTTSVAPAVTETAAPVKTRRPTRSKAPATPPASPLWSDGSVDVGGKRQASSVVTIKTGERLTALTVTIRLARTPELVSRGGSQQVPGASVTSDVTEEGGALVYRFTLSSGDTLEPGTYTFVARYTYAPGGRDARADTYAAAATSGNGTPLTVGGDFG